LDRKRVWNLKTFGSGRRVERRTFDHFHKSFPLSPVPPHLFQQEEGRDDKDNDNIYTSAGLFLPDPQRWIPDWGHRKLLASIYGPQYLNYASMPLPKLPGAEAIHEKRRERQRERVYRNRAEKVKKKLRLRALEMVKEDVEVFVDKDKIETVKKISQVAASSKLDDYTDHKATFVGPRRLQKWDSDTFRKLKGPGDPMLPKEFRDMIFEMYVSTIDKNNDVPAWKKIYAMHLIPRAFGGMEGEFLDQIQDEPELMTKVDDSAFAGRHEVSQIETESDGLEDLGL